MGPMPVTLIQLLADIAVHVSYLSYRDIDQPVIRFGRTHPKETPLARS